ncbi:hypothetical protein JOQ06_008212, partial [Pogonophryne albipinna]
MPLDNSFSRKPHNFALPPTFLAIHWRCGEADPGSVAALRPVAVDTERAGAETGGGGVAKKRGGAPTGWIGKLEGLRAS